MTSIDLFNLPASMIRVTPDYYEVKRTLLDRLRSDFWRSHNKFANFSHVNAGFTYLTESDYDLWMSLHSNSKETARHART